MRTLFLVFVLCLTCISSSSLYNQLPKENENAMVESSVSGAEGASIPTQSEQRKDLTAQETFYPIGGVWWGVRPWGGWGGYRPWYGWGGYRPWYGWGGYRPWYGWHGPHWGGHWGGHWGQGGARWRR